MFLSHLLNRIPTGYKSMPTDLNSFLHDGEAKPVLDQISRCRWRKARDLAKDLCRKNRSRYLPLLIAANQGLAQEMIGKGLLKDAETVVQYLATIAPAESIAELRAAIQHAANPARSGSPGASSSTNPSPNPADLWLDALALHARVQQGGDLMPTDLCRLDSLVATKFLSPDSLLEASQISFADELRAVRTARDATGAGEWDVARDALRCISAQSVFRHWRMFLRGVRCVFEDDTATAAKCFASLPAESSLAMAAHVIAPNLAVAAHTCPLGVKTPFLLQCIGQPAHWAKAIITSTAEFKARRPVKAYRMLCEGLGSAFPCEMPGFTWDLTNHAVLGARDEANPRHKQDDQVGSFLPKALTIEALRKFPACVPWFRVLSREPSPRALQEASLDHALLAAYWESVYGPNPVRDSILWTRCVETIVKSEPPRFNFLGFRQSPALSRKDSPLGKKVETLLTKAFLLNPNNEVAWRKLLEHYQNTKNTAARNRLLDQLSKIHPNHKEVLFQNGIEAVKRKAFKKGLQSLRDAWALDPLDRKVKCEIATGLLLQIRDVMAKGRDDTQIWEELEPLLESSCNSDFLPLSRWLVSLAKSIRAGTPSDACAALAPSPIEHQFAVFMLQNAAGQAPKSTRWMSKWVFDLNDLGVTWQQWLQMLRLALACCNRPVFGSLAFSQLEPTLFRACCHFIDSLDENLSDLIGMLHSPAFEPICIQHERHVRSLFKNFLGELDKRYSGVLPEMDPHYRIADIALKLYTDPYVDAEFMLHLLTGILHEKNNVNLNRHLPAVALLKQQAEKILLCRGAAFNHFDDDEDDDFDDIF